MNPLVRLAACSSDRSVARSTGRLVVALLNPAAPEASACSAAGIRWALEDLVASCLHHRQWHEVQARSTLPPARPSHACSHSRLPSYACSCPGHACSCLLHMKSVFVTGYALCLFPTSCDFPRPRSRTEITGGYPASAVAHPRTRTNTKRGPVSRPPLYPINGLNVTACRTRSPKLRCLPVPSDAVACSTGS